MDTATSTETHPLASIIIPVYNCAAYLSEALDSALGQTLESIEVIVVDDGSTDSTPNILRHYTSQDARLQAYTTENHGQGHARNLALERARGSFVLFLDADDTLDLQAADIAANRALQDDSDFVAFSYGWNKGEGIYKLHEPEPYFDQPTLTTRADINTMLDCKAYFSVTRLYRREFLERHAIRYAEGYLYEDNPFILSTILNAERVSTINRDLYRVRTNQDSSTRTQRGTNRHCRDYIQAVHACVDLLLEHAGDDSIESARYFYSRYALKSFMKYYYARIPPNLRAAYARDFVREMNRLGPFPTLLDNDRQMAFIAKHGVYEKESATLLRLLTFYRKKARPLLRR